MRDVDVIVLDQDMTRIRQAQARVARISTDGTARGITERNRRGTGS